MKSCVSHPWMPWSIALPGALANHVVCSSRVAGYESALKKNTYHPCRLAHWTKLHNSANTADQSRNQHEDAQEKLYKFKSEASNSAQEAIRWQSHQQHVKRNMLQSIPVAAVSSCTRALKMEKHMAAHQEWKVNDMEKVKYMNKVEERWKKTCGGDESLWCSTIGENIWKG